MGVTHEEDGKVQKPNCCLWKFATDVFFEINEYTGAQF